MSKIKFSAFLTIILTAIIIIPIASAENVNVTPVTTPFITIDPIGNHTIGDVFFINGTTNLPVTENLTLGINSAYRSAMKDSPPFPYQSIQINNISVISKDTLQLGTNWWSVNISDNVKELRSDNYQVLVVSSRDNMEALTQSSITAGSSFYLFPANNSIKSNVLQTTFQSPSPILPAISATSPTPTISQTASSTQLTPTNATSLSLILSVTALMGIVVLRLFNRKKRE